MLTGANGVAHLARRAVEAAAKPDKMKMEDMPPWAFVLLAANLLVLLPVFFYLGYTLNLLPTYAMIEDAAPPAYEPVALTDDSAVVDDAENPSAPGGRKPLPALPTRTTSGEPISSSVRGLHRMLLSLGGWRSLFRGIGPAFVFAIIFGIVMSVLSSLLPKFIATLVAHLVTLPLSTAWLHIVISAPVKLHFWHRIPSLKTTFKACAVPITVVWLATTLMDIVPAVLLPAQYVPGGTTGGQPTPKPTARDGVLFLVVAIVQILLVLGLAVPAEAVLRRVQASMLPETHDTIVSFDRSFGGQVEPAVVGGPGFVHWRVALKSFDFAAWKRLIKLYIKIIALTFAIFAGLALVLVPQLWLIYSKCKKD